LTGAGAEDGLRARLEQVVAKILQRQSELDTLLEEDSEQQLGPPASDAALDALEQQAGFPLPPDYRLFLSMHDGWSAFNGQNDLLSTTQRQTRLFQRSIERTKEIQREQNDPAVDGFIIEASTSDTDIAFLDPARHRTDGTMDVVRWDARASEYERVPSFEAYLAKHLEFLERWIAEEKSKLR